MNASLNTGGIYSSGSRCQREVMLGEASHRSQLVLVASILLNFADISCRSPDVCLLFGIPTLVLPFWKWFISPACRWRVFMHTWRHGRLTSPDLLDYQIYLELDDTVQLVWTRQILAFRSQDIDYCIHGWSFDLLCIITSSKHLFSITHKSIETTGRLPQATT